MTRFADRRYILAVILATMTALGLAASWFGAPVFPFGVCAFLVLSLVPGAAVYRLSSKEPEVVEEITAAVALSPVLTATAATLLMLAGVGARETATVALLLASFAGMVALFLRRSAGSSVKSLSGCKARETFIIPPSL